MGDVLRKSHGGKKNSRQILIKHRQRTDPWRKEGANGTARFRRNASESPSPPSAGSRCPHTLRGAQCGGGCARRSAAAPRAPKAVLAGIYVFICLLHLKLNGEGWGGGGITGFLHAFAVHTASYLFKPNTTQTRHKHTRTFFKKRLQMCPFKKNILSKGKGRKKRRGDKTSGQQQQNLNKSECCSLALPVKWCCRGIRTERRT